MQNAMLMQKCINDYIAFDAKCSCYIAFFLAGGKHCRVCTGGKQSCVYCGKHCRVCTGGKHCRVCAGGKHCRVCALVVNTAVCALVVNTVVFAVWGPQLQAPGQLLQVLSSSP